MKNLNLKALIALPLTGTILCDALFACPSSGILVEGYYEGCSGNNITYNLYSCPVGEITQPVESVSCASWSVYESFQYCHECGGRAVCSDSTDKSAVCGDVVNNRCEATNYEVTSLECKQIVDVTTCVGGVSAQPSQYELPTCTEAFDEVAPQCLQCSDDIVFCTKAGTTCRDITGAGLVPPVPAPVPTVDAPIESKGTNPALAGGIGAAITIMILLVVAGWVMIRKRGVSGVASPPPPLPLSFPPATEAPVEESMFDPPAVPMAAVVLIDEAYSVGASGGPRFKDQARQY